jgi:hypothetical protein
MWLMTSGDFNLLEDLLESAGYGVRLSASVKRPSNSIEPVERTMLQIARSVVVLPASLVPSSVVRLPR